MEKLKKPEIGLHGEITVDRRAELLDIVEDGKIIETIKLN